MRHALRETYVHRVLGDRIFGRHIWQCDVSAVAGGLSLGLFVAFTPTIPFQMLMCAVGCLILGVNLPIALAACWVTNPVTAVPIYWTAHRCGKFLIVHSGIESNILGLLSHESPLPWLMTNSLYLWTGSVIFGLAAAVAGNVGVRLLWSGATWLRNTNRIVPFSRIRNRRNL